MLVGVSAVRTAKKMFSFKLFDLFEFIPSNETSQSFVSSRNFLAACSAFEKRLNKQWTLMCAEQTDLRMITMCNRVSSLFLSCSVF